MFIRFFSWYLKRKGHVVLLLNTSYRHCGAVCWLDEYAAANKRETPGEV